MEAFRLISCKDIRLKHGMKENASEEMKQCKSQYLNVQKTENKNVH